MGAKTALYMEQSSLPFDRYYKIYCQPFWPQDDVHVKLITFFLFLFCSHHSLLFIFLLSRNLNKKVHTCFLGGVKLKAFVLFFFCCFVLSVDEELY